MMWRQQVLGLLRGCLARRAWALLVLSLAPCAPDDVHTAGGMPPEGSSGLEGRPSYVDCTDRQQFELDIALEQARRITDSVAFARCVDNAPYVPNKGDFEIWTDPAPYVLGLLHDFVRPLVVTCADLPGAYARATEAINERSAWGVRSRPAELLVDRGKLDAIGADEGLRRPADQRWKRRLLLTATLLHEISHYLQFWHEEQPGSLKCKNTMPYILERCAEIASVCTGAARISGTDVPGDARRCTDQLMATGTVVVQDFSGDETCVGSVP
jgi:hypothetical protein